MVAMVILLVLMPAFILGCYGEPKWTLPPSGEYEIVAKIGVLEGGRILWVLRDTKRDAEPVYYSTYKASISNFEEFATAKYAIVIEVEGDGSAGNYIKLK